MLVHELELDLEAFEGPLDLLLTLVLKEEMPLVDVDVAGIVLTFVEELASRSRRASAPAGRSPAPLSPDVADGTVPYGSVRSTIPSGPAPPAPPREREEAEREELDLEACGDFLVLVSSLLELKARTLFPDGDGDLLELDPEEAAEELARRLAEYRRMKDASAWLAERLNSEGDRYFRLGPAPLAPAPARELDPQEPARLATALRVLAAEPPVVSLGHMALRFPPVSLFLERFRALLRRRRQFDFDQQVQGLDRAEQAVAFLALLELRKANEISLSQAEPFAPIRVARAGEETTAQGERRTA